MNWAFPKLLRPRRGTDPRWNCAPPANRGSNRAIPSALKSLFAFARGISSRTTQLILNLGNRFTARAMLVQLYVARLHLSIERHNRIARERIAAATQQFGK